MYDYLIDIYLKEKEMRKSNPKAYDDELFKAPLQKRKIVYISSTPLTGKQIALNKTCSI